MSKPVQDKSFWKKRIEDAKSQDKLWHSVYVSTRDRWNAIEEFHKRVLKRSIPPGSKVLDAGCGYGRMKEFISSFADYTGVDFSEDFIKLAGDKCLVADLKSLPFKDKEFDVAFCISVKAMIESNCGLDEWKKMEDELNRVAKKVLILEYTTE